MKVEKISSIAQFVLYWLGWDITVSLTLISALVFVTGLLVNELSIKTHCLYKHLFFKVYLSFVVITHQLIVVYVCFKFQLSEFVLENPADVPVVVQVLPLNVYPNVQTLLDTITPSLIPRELGSDLVVSGEDDPDSDVFTLPDLTEQSGLQPMPPGDTTSLNALRRAVETTLGVRPHRRTFSMLVPPRVKLAVRSKFQPKDDSLKTSLIIIRFVTIQCMHSVVI